MARLVEEAIPRSELGGGGTVFTEPRSAVIREQLERILASPLFRNSKRYPNLLRYVVLQALEGNGEDLKERTLGIEVFGRQPDYDSNHDPVVRTSAVEVRKRLAQYYQEPGHEDEIRIDLPPGSYVPEFRLPHSEVGINPVVAVSPLAFSAVSNADVKATAVTVSRKSPVRKLAVAIASVCVLAALWLSVTYWRQPALNRFWMPIRTSRSAILFGVSGNPGSPQDPNGASATSTEVLGAGQSKVPFGDVTALVNIARYILADQRSFQIQLFGSIRLEDLKAGPAVFIGYNTRWMELLSKDLRFTVDRNSDATLTWINDRQNPNSRNWSVEVNAPLDSTAEAYALITRVWNTTTGQPMVSISGLSPYATSAAGEFLSHPEYLEQVAQNAPYGWYKKNIQIVIAATRVGTSNGTPRAVATYFW